MDTLHKAFKEKKWTDLELILDDGSNKIHMNVHKIILAKDIPFFEKLLFFGDDLPTHILKVPSAAVAYDLIMSSYGLTSRKGSYSKWHWELEMAKCRDYFGLDIFMPDAKGEVIEEGDYDYFLELCGMTGIDEDLTKIIIKNLPVNYDLGKLSSEIMQVMIEGGKIYMLTILNHSKVEIWDVRNPTDPLIKIPCAIYVFKHVRVSPDYKYLSIIEGPICRIWDIENNKLYFQYGNTRINPYGSIFTPDGLYFMIVVNACSIKILNLTDLSLQDYYQGENSISDQYFSPNGKHLLIIFHDSIKILDYNIGQKPTKTHLIENPYDTLSFSPDSKYLVASNKNSNTRCIIWDLETFAPIDFHGLLPPRHFAEISFLQQAVKVNFDKEYIAFKNNGRIEIYDFSKKTLINTFDANQCVRVIFSPDNTLVALLRTNNVDVYNIVSSEHLQTFDNYNHVTFSPNNEYIAMARDDYITIVNLSNRKTIFSHNIDIKYNPFDSVLEFSPDSKLLTFLTKNLQMTFDILSGSSTKIQGQKHGSIRIHYDELSRRLMSYVKN